MVILLTILILSIPKVIFSYLFGSLSKGRPSPLSDVDIAVFLKKAEKFADRKFEILGRLIDILENREYSVNSVRSIFFGNLVLRRLAP
jgi:predicted nucleotidyltransferase